MKQSEIIPRQNRVIYVLMVVVAILALFWATWEHMVHTETPEQRQASKTGTAGKGKSVIMVQNRKK